MIFRRFAVAAVATGLGVAGMALPAAGAATAVSGANHPTGHAVTGVQQSSNWSGYAVTGKYTSAVGHWKVPTVSGSGNHYSSQWVGIDGYNNSNLIQTGTEADVVNGQPQYDAWWEILPAPETVISMTVHPGDSMTGSVSKVSGLTWSISLTDNTTGATFSTSKRYLGSGASAEWIVEATQVNGTVGTPPAFTKVPFTSSTANGANPHLNTSEEIEMVQGNTVYAKPSAPNSSGNGFSVSYK
jgi:hypothetical protein